MRRHEKLVDISRREFCALAGCLGLSVVACTDGDVKPVQTGALGDTPDAPDQGPVDAADIDARPGSPDASDIDARPGSPDAKPAPDAGTTQNVCGTNPTDCGAPPTSFTTTPKLVSKFFVVRDSGGLYAVSAICTHQGATLEVDGSEFYCPRHGAQFNFDGSIISGPVSRTLVHYAMCIMSSGNVGVMTGTTVSTSTRMNV